MTVCLKCGAANPPTNQYCVRCEMPLPHSGVGGTLQGGALERPVGTQPLAAAGIAPPQPAPPQPAPPQPAPRAPAAAPGLGQTLFGVSPAAPAVAPPVPAPAAAQPPLSAAQANPAPGLGQTLFGVAPAPPGRPPAAPALQRAPAQAAGSPGQTSPGVVPPAAAPAAAASGLAQRTLMGVAPQAFAARPAAGTQLGASPLSGQREPAPDPAASRARPGTTAPFEPVRNAATMLGTTSGFPQPGRAPAPASPTADTAAAGSEALASLPDAAEPAEAAAPGFGMAANHLHARTQLGVAIPGIAPLRSGGGPLPAPPPAEASAEVASPLPLSTAIPGRFKVPRGALVLLGSGAVLLTAAIAFALLWTGAKPISATVASDPTGRERIDLVCSDCPDGTQLTLGDVGTEVRDRKAYLLPKTPLALGENQLQLGMQKPGGSLQEVEVRLPPVEYRIHPDTSTLAGDKPRLRLELETLPGTQVQLGTDNVAVDAQGHGVQEIDVSGQLLGQATEISTFEQAVPYVITPPSGKTYRGELRVKIGITPLLLEAPGTDSVTELERFMLAGRTTNGAEVWVAGSALPVDANGRFAQLMSIESVGQTNVTVRATQRGLAPRFASFRLERVRSLESALSARKPGALTLAEVNKDIPGSVGKALLLRGRIEEVRVDGQRSLLILAADDCSGRDCLARLSYGGLRKLERGARVTALGKVLGSAANQNVPEIEVSLLL